MWKVTLNMPGVSILRTFDLAEVDQRLNAADSPNQYSTISKAKANQENIVALANFLLTLKPDEWSKRIENYSIDIYTNSADTYANLIEQFKVHVEHCFEPEDPDLLISTSSVIAKKLPHGKYKFKVFLLPHKMKSPEDKQLYIDWIELQGGKILMSEAVKKWFIETQWNWDRRYILVEDENTLLMLKLRGASLVGRIHDYVIVE